MARKLNKGLLNGDERRDCPCSRYSDSPSYDPREEESARRIRIEHEQTPPGGRPLRTCRCRECGAVFEVQEGEHHAPWWQWTRVSFPAGRWPQ